MDQNTIDKLLETAWHSLQQAYAPYSGFQVGAAILSAGHITGGCNVENASYGLTICAERNAIAKARVEGNLRVGHLEAVLVAVKSDKPAFPCGACRQVLHEFGNQDTVVFLSIEPGQVAASHTLSDLLPGAFGPSDLGVRPDA